MISKILLFTSRIDNKNSFPHPLSPEKEKEYLEKMFNGDAEAKNILIKHNLRLVAYIVKKYNNYPDQDELISIGSLGLIKAVSSFKPTKGTQLATYASKCIENEILMTMRSHKKQSKNVSLYDVVGSDKDGNQLALIDLLAVDEESVYSNLDNELLKDTLAKIINGYLSKREQTLINLRYGLKSGVFLTQQEVSVKLNISRSYVSRIEKKALAKLDAAIKKENIML